MRRKFVGCGKISQAKWLFSNLVRKTRYKLTIKILFYFLHCFETDDLVSFKAVYILMAGDLILRNNSEKISTEDFPLKLINLGLEK